MQSIKFYLKNDYLLSLQYANEDSCWMLIANKSDKDERQVDKSRGEKVRFFN